MKKSILSGFSGILSGILGFVIALPEMLVSHSAMAGEWPTDQNAYLQSNTTYTGAATSANMDGVTEGALKANAWYRISSGYYLPANSATAEPCPAGYYCEGGDYAVAAERRGVTGVCATGYSTGGATSSACTACTYGSATGAGYANHDQASDCKKSVTLDKNNRTGTTTKTCYQGVKCDFSLTGISQAGYEFTGWGTSKDCQDNTMSFTNPSAEKYYACKKEAVIELLLDLEANATQHFATYYYKYKTPGFYATSNEAENGTGTKITKLANLPSQSNKKFAGFYWPSDTGAGYLISSDGTIGAFEDVAFMDNNQQAVLRANFLDIGVFPLTANPSYNNSSIALRSRGSSDFYYTIDKTVYTGDHYAVRAYSDRAASQEITKIDVPVAENSGYVFLGYYTETGGNGTQAIDMNGNIKTDWLNSLTNVYTSGTVSLYGGWGITSIHCDAGQYLNQDSFTCVACPAGYACPGGDFDLYSSNMKTECSQGSYSTGGASECTPCTTGFTTDPSQLATSAGSCVKVLNLYNSGGTGTGVGIWDNTGRLQFTCSQATATCDLPDTTKGSYKLEQAGYTFNGEWGAQGCVNGVKSVSTTTALSTDTWYACKSGVQITINWTGVAASAGGSGNDGAKSTTVSYGGDIVTPAAAMNPQTSGQIFLGWKFVNPNPSSN